MESTEGADKTTKIDELKETVKKFCEDRDWNQFHNAKELSIGVATEAGELLQHFRFKNSEQVEKYFEKHREELSDEIADVLFFLLRLSQRYDVDLTTALQNKIKKNDKKYPVEESKGSNEKR